MGCLKVKGRGEIIRGVAKKLLDLILKSPETINALNYI